jgi:metal-responsive CopG/Arc/MetJ family transcriptional regulator
MFINKLAFKGLRSVTRMRQDPLDNIEYSKLLNAISQLEHENHLQGIDGVPVYQLRDSLNIKDYKKEFPMLSSRIGVLKKHGFVSGKARGSRSTLFIDWRGVSMGIMSFSGGLVYYSRAFMFADGLDRKLVPPMLTRGLVARSLLVQEIVKNYLTQSLANFPKQSLRVHLEQARSGFGALMFSKLSGPSQATRATIKHQHIDEETYYLHYFFNYCLQGFITRSGMTQLSGLAFDCALKTSEQAGMVELIERQHILLSKDNNKFSDVFK